MQGEKHNLNEQRNQTIDRKTDNGIKEREGEKIFYFFKFTT